jgi:hypothetical protein
MEGYATNNNSNTLYAHLRLGINLTELQRTLDAQGLEVVENQKESVVGRKGLADKTRGVYYTLSIRSRI